MTHVSDDFEGYIILISLEFLRSIQIDLKNVLPLYMYIKNHPCVSFPARAVEEISRFYHLLQQCADDTRSKRRTEIVKGIISALIYKICDELERLTLPSEELVGNRREALFVHFLDLLTEHHRQQRSVGFYASRLHITPKYMSSLIKEVSGRSAAQWIDDYVILEAKSLLKYSDLSIQEIAYRLNFSPSRFSGNISNNTPACHPDNIRPIKGQGRSDGGSRRRACRNNNGHTSQDDDRGRIGRSPRMETGSGPCSFHDRHDDMKKTRTKTRPGF